MAYHEEKVLGSALLTMLLRPVQQLRENVDALLEAPDSSLDAFQERVKVEFELECAGRGEEWLAQELVSLLDQIDCSATNQLDVALSRQRARIAQDDPLIDVFLEILDQCHHQFPGSPLAFIANPSVWGRAHIRVLSSLRGLEDTNGERRARATMAALLEAVELLYKPYTKRLWLAWHLADGKTCRHPAQFGSTIAGLAPLVNHDFVVSARARVLRNASAHEQYRYLPKEDTIRYWTAPNDEQSARAIPVSEVIDEIWRYVDAAVAFHRAVNTFMGELGMRALLPVMRRLPDALRGRCSPEEQARLDRDGAMAWESLFCAIPLEVLEASRNIDDIVLGGPAEQKEN
jgi:hypothetical protein